MQWGELSWPQIEALDKERVVVIPTGSCEQHGHHLPLLTDTFLVTEIAGRVEAQVHDEIVLLPPLWLGSSDHHGDFPGTLSVSAALYSEMIKSLTRGVLRAGFRRIFYLHGHGGNDLPTSQALADLSSESDLANAAWLASATYWSVAEATIRPEQHGLAQAKLAHSCEYETSMLLVVTPDLVDMAKVAVAPPVIADRWWSSEIGGKVNVFRRFNRLTASGAMGRPGEASEAKGDSLLEAVVGEVVAFLRDFRQWPDAPVIRGQLPNCPARRDQPPRSPRQFGSCPTLVQNRFLGEVVAQSSGVR